MRWRAEGPKSWRDHRHLGGSPKLMVPQQQQLIALLTRGARAYGYLTDLWTLRRVAEVMRKEYGVEYTLSGVWRVLRALAFSAQVPLTRAFERDVAYIRHSVRKTWPEIFRRAMDTNATLLFVDEAGVQRSPNVRRRWAEEGSRRV
ncbi:MAG: winged helix-turn-helix domain-containing protein [Thermoplasmata archaeon]|nr:winged helix-turn-helix domain-containing protein [Thermoplasmata archaeon]